MFYSGSHNKEGRGGVKGGDLISQSAVLYNGFHNKGVGGGGGNLISQPAVFYSGSHNKGEGGGR